MPYITKAARHTFAGYNADKQADAVQNVLVWAFENLKSLASTGRLQNAYAVSITRFAIGRHHEGRSLGTVTSSCDVMSPHCQNLGRSKVKNFGLAENITDSFTSEAAATDSRYPVDRTVQFKMDFIEGWLQEQTKRDRAIIVDLAMGESTGDVARKYSVSDGLISQYRKRFHASWLAYISDKKDDALKAA
jgi:hypothetical protein